MKNVIRAVCFILTLIFITSFISCENKGKRYTVYYYDIFDTSTEIIGYAESKSEFDAVCCLIKDELYSYHKLYDIYNSYDGIINICDINKTQNGKHQKLTVDDKIIGLIEFSKEMYFRTGGYVNIALGSVLTIWSRYREDGLLHPENAVLPPSDELESASKHTDINSIIINKEEKTVFLSDGYMTLDVGAVAKGYAVEKTAQMLEEKGISGYLINVGGNIRTVGKKNDGTAWRIGIENVKKDSDESYIAYVLSENSSVVTSGSDKRYYTVDGVEYHHIINPDTLMPDNRFLSVSVVTESSALGDALSTALFNMSYEKGLQVIRSFDGCEAIWLTLEGNKLYSDGFIH